MSEIPEIQIQSVGINEIAIPNIYNYVPHTFSPPVVIQIGSPIVDMPGCVKYHPDSADNRDTPNLKEDDSEGTRVLCDATYPTYDAMDYTPDQLNIYVETPPPKVAPPPEPPGAPEVPPTGGIATETECPGPNQLRVGDLTSSGDERVIGHELQNNICVTLYEPTTAVEKFLPSTNQVSTTAAIAVVATAAAAATPLLLRLIKPIIKKLTTTIQKKLGKEPPKLSRNELQCNKYREKKGLPPFKRPKKKN
jgi:hypothetical protein|tara:strand:- start:95 stop:844 length:750 start_codon:yes stop_codon:yes gene_type:complete